MRRIASAPRACWRSKVEAAGLTWHAGERDGNQAPAALRFARVSQETHPYWNESAFYEFTSTEIDLLASATNELAEMTLRAAQHVIDQQLYARLSIPALAIPLIEHSWEADSPSLYGRFDLLYDGANPPKLLEYNADTPTSLLEAAVVQWFWLEEIHPHSDQFNSIHERLIEQWRYLAPHIPRGRVDFCSMDNEEDWTTAVYLQDTAQQAGLQKFHFLH